MKLDFNTLKTAVQRQFVEMQVGPLFKVSVGRDELWELYLASFPEGANPIFRERTEHDCQCCKAFVRNIGGLVTVAGNKLVSLWDINIGGPYQVVADALTKLVKSRPIDNIFLHGEATVGTDKNFQQLENEDILTWHHFYVRLPDNLTMSRDAINAKTGDARTTKEVMLRSLSEITSDAINTVLELIDQNSLYRGEEHKHAVEKFALLKREFDKLASDSERDIFCWSGVQSVPQPVSRIRGTVIGSLLVDLSEGKDLENAVSSFEAKVAPTNYKRPTALITQAMIDKAKETIEELGLTSALERRYAVIEDITINNVLFADRGIRKRMHALDDIAPTAPTKKMEKVDEVNIGQFISNILPHAESIEIMFENRHVSNLVSLIAPCDLTAKRLFKWPNNFSWSYNGEVADSIKERVKRAGGRIDADLRCSLSWFNYDDLDLHMAEPGGFIIYYGNKGQTSRNGGMLDVDMNAGHGQTREGVENICYESRSSMKEGDYILRVHNYCKRETSGVGFDVEVEFDGKIYTFHYANAVRDREFVDVAKIRYAKGKFEILESLPSSESVKEVWGVPTQTFHKVQAIMLSPNYWDGNGVGNKHFFFMLENCRNDGKARGFFNEFLSPELDQHRKVLEVVGSKMKTAESDNQLSGIGFSSTQKNHVACKVKGTFTRTIKITF